MNVTDEHVAVLRAYLTSGDVDEPLDRLGARTGTAALFASAFFEAGTRRFGKSWTPADVIRFVAHARAWWGRQADEIDARSAELFVRSMLGEAPSEELDDSVKVLQLPLLLVLVADANYDDDELDEFLARARERAEHIEG